MENLRIDLILEGEQRSTAPISLQGVARIVGVAAPLLILLGIAWAVVRFMAVKNTERMREAEWLLTEPQYEEAQKLTASMQTHRKILKLVEGWEKSILHWTDPLTAIRDHVPAGIQLVGLKVTHDIRAADGKTKRFYGLLLQGKAVGTNAQHNVDGLRGDLASLEPFKDHVLDVVVREFEADTDKEADKADRTFQISSRYKPRVLE